MEMALRRAERVSDWMTIPLSRATPRRVAIIAMVAITPEVSSSVRKLRAAQSWYPAERRVVPNRAIQSVLTNNTRALKGRRFRMLSVRSPFDFAGPSSRRPVVVKTTVPAMAIAKLNT